MIFVVGSSGGLSPNNALLHINAPAGSTITLSKGGVTVKVLEASKGHTNSDGVTADWYYSVSNSNYGTWTVTAAKESNTATASIEVSANKQYDVSLDYALYFIENGVFKLTYTTYNMTANEGSSGTVIFTGTGTYPKCWSQQLTAGVLNGGYSKLSADIVSYTGAANMYVGLSSNTSASAGTPDLAAWTGKNITELTHVEIDITNVQITNSYVKLGYSAVIQCIIKNLYLER